MKLSVLMFLPQFRPGSITYGIGLNQNGGAERHAESLAVALAAAGSRVAILTPRYDPDSPTVESVNGVTIERFPFLDLSYRYPMPGVAVLNIPYIIWQIVRAVWARRNGVDVLHCHLGSLQTAAVALAARLIRVPMLCTAGTADERSDLGEIERTGACGRLIAGLVRATIQTWVATTLAVEEALIRAGVERRKIVRIPNGVNLANYLRPCRQSRSVKRFLYLGRLSKNARRDIPGLIKAFDRLAVSFHDVELAIVGGGGLFEETRRLAENCVAHDRIRLAGFDRPEKWLAWADCFVLPSRREGLSVALLEAMAAGLPCIANDIPPNREVLDDGKVGVLVPVENCDALESAMHDMVENNSLARSLALKAQERAERCYSIDSVAARYANLYEFLRARR